MSWWVNDCDTFDTEWAEQDYDSITKSLPPAPTRCLNPSYCLDHESDVSVNNETDGRETTVHDVSAKNRTSPMRVSQGREHVRRNECRTQSG